MRITCTRAYYAGISSQTAVFAESPGSLYGDCS